MPKTPQRSRGSRELESQRSRDAEESENQRIRLSEQELWPSLVKKLADESIRESEEPYEYKSRTWEFVRHMKALAMFDGVTAEQAFDRIPWECTEFDADDQIKFLDEWDKVKWAAGFENPLKQAALMAEANPIFDPAAFPSPKFARFLSIAAWQQRIVGEGNIFYSTRDMGALVDVDAKTISTYSSVAEKKGFLRLVKKGGGKLASRFRFNLDRVPNMKNKDN